MPVDENVCDIKMTALADQIKLMLKPITDGIDRIEGNVRALTDGARAYVLRSEFDKKCAEIEDLKRFVWRVSGGLSVVTFLIGLAVKLVK